MTGMKREAKLVIVLAAVVLVLGLFLLPVVPITVEPYCSPHLIGCPLSESVSASMMYAYFGVGSVYVPNYSGGNNYCVMYGNPGTMCGVIMQRMS